MGVCQSAPSASNPGGKKNVYQQGTDCDAFNALYNMTCDRASQLGKGSYATVYRATEVETGKVRRPRSAPPAASAAPAGVRPLASALRRAIPPRAFHRALTRAPTFFPRRSR